MWEVSNPVLRGVSMVSLTTSVRLWDSGNLKHTTHIRTPPTIMVAVSSADIARVYLIKEYLHYFLC